MRLASWLFVGSALAAAVACTTDYQKGADDPRYGIPNALANEAQPGPSVDQKTTSADGGASQPLCVKAGGMLVDGGACTVKFSEVVQLIGAATPSCTAPSCHGGATPPNQPRIDPADVPGMYTAWAAFTLSDGKPYINPCSTDDTKAGMGCNLLATGACGAHMPQGGQMDQAAIDKINTWLKCGSPNNP